MKSRVVTLMAVLGLSMGMVGCSSNCDISCERYQECVDSDFDVERCTDTCLDRSEDADFESQTRECAQCIADQDTCSEVTERCWDDCLGVVLAPRR